MTNTRYLKLLHNNRRLFYREEAAALLFQVQSKCKEVEKIKKKQREMQSYTKKHKKYGK